MKPKSGPNEEGEGIKDVPLTDEQVTVLRSIASNSGKLIELDGIKFEVSCAGSPEGRLFIVSLNPVGSDGGAERMSISFYHSGDSMVVSRAVGIDESMLQELLRRGTSFSGPGYEVDAGKGSDHSAEPRQMQLISSDLFSKLQLAANNREPIVTYYGNSYYKVLVSLDGIRQVYSVIVVPAVHEGGSYRRSELLVDPNTGVVEHEHDMLKVEGIGSMMELLEGIEWAFLNRN